MEKVIAIVGPTGVGKTKLSVELARRIDGEIINCDSTQVYKHLNIATAKVKEEEKEGIPHHLLDMKELDEVYTVYDFQKDARRKIREILKRGKIPILVGGTGLYLKAVLYDYEFEEETSSKEYTESTEELYQRVRALDFNTKIHPHNRKRLCRYLSYYEATGKKLSDKEKSEQLLYDATIIGLTTDRSILYENINKRVDKMVKEGLIEEAKALYDAHIMTKAIMTPIGYKELFPYFEHKISKEEALDYVKQKSRNYAKRQYTWFQNQMQVVWFTVNFTDFCQTVEEVHHYLVTTKGF